MGITLTEVIRKFNPYHDKKGRFTSSDSASFMTFRTKDPNKQHMADAAVERAKKQKGISMPKGRTEDIDWTVCVPECKSMDELKQLLEEHLPGVVELAEKYKKMTLAECNDKKSKGDLILYDILKSRSFDGKPKTVEDQEIDEYAKSSGNNVFYRGFDNSSSSSITGKEKADDFIEGKTYAGYGFYGNGTYAAAVLDSSDHTQAFNIANTYANGAKESIIKFTVKSKENWGNYTDINAEESGLRKQLGEFKKEYLSHTSDDYEVSVPIEEDKELIDSLSFIVCDEGRYAALRGYDGYNCGSSTYEDDYTVILNHGNILVSDKRYE